MYGDERQWLLCPTDFNKVSIHYEVSHFSTNSSYSRRKKEQGTFVVVIGLTVNLTENSANFAP